MKIYLFFVVIFASMWSGWADVMRSMPSTHKDFPNQCYVQSEKKGFTVGEHTPIGICKKIICASDFSYQIHGCGVARVEGYRQVIDYKKPYPDCCENFVKET